MTFAPVLPATGIVGFRLLEQTETAQRAVFDRQPEIARDVAYFEENIASVRTAEDLVADRRLLRVALGAFGLEDQLDQRAFMRKILAEGSESDEAFANRFVDPRYKDIARTFGFGDLIGPRTAFAGFPGEITAAYKERKFEIAVGDQSEDLRLSLNFRREISRYARSADPEGVAWFSVMGDLPVRRVMEGVFGLSSSFGQLDLDRQRDELRDLNSQKFGSRSLEVFKDPKNIDQAISIFLARSSINSGPSLTTPGMAAISILSGGREGAGIGLQNLINSINI